MPLLFSYGTLQEEPVQVRTFGRRVRTLKDDLPGFEKTTVTVDNPEFVALSGKARHANVVFNGRDDSRVPGSALEVTDEELALADRYEEMAGYERISVRLASGKSAWVYADGRTIGNHWAAGDVYALIVAALRKMSKPLDGLTVEDLAPVDHFHARGLPATIELADKLPVKSSDLLLDIGCGLGGPARYMASRFGCRVAGIDITAPFVAAANKLTALLRMEGRVEIELGDGQRLPYPDAHFDGAYAQHVTMNIADRRGFFTEVRRVLKPGAFFALTEHGLGPTGSPHFPVPWSSDGRGSYLIPPAQTQALLEECGFEDIAIEHTGPKYAAGYRKAIERAQAGTLPPLGTHLLLGETAPEKTRNALRNIEEGRTDPIQLVCRKTS